MNITVICFSKCAEEATFYSKPLQLQHEFTFKGDIKGVMLLSDKLVYREK